MDQSDDTVFGNDADGYERVVDHEADSVMQTAAKAYNRGDADNIEDAIDAAASNVGLERVEEVTVLAFTESDPQPSTEVLDGDEDRDEALTAFATVSYREDIRRSAHRRFEDAFDYRDDHDEYVLKTAICGGCGKLHRLESVVTFEEMDAEFDEEDLWTEIGGHRLDDDAYDNREEVLVCLQCRTPNRIIECPTDAPHLAISGPAGVIDWVKEALEYRGAPFEWEFHGSTVVMWGDALNEDSKSDLIADIEYRARDAVSPDAEMDANEATSEVYRSVILEPDADPEYMPTRLPVTHRDLEGGRF